MGAENVPRYDAGAFRQGEVGGASRKDGIADVNVAIFRKEANQTLAKSVLRIVVSQSCTAVGDAGKLSGSGLTEKDAILP